MDCPGFTLTRWLLGIRSSGRWWINLRGLLSETDHWDWLFSYRQSKAAVTICSKFDSQPFCSPLAAISLQATLHLCSLILLTCRSSCVSSRIIHNKSLSFQHIFYLLRILLGLGWISEPSCFLTYLLVYSIFYLDFCFVAMSCSLTCWTWFSLVFGGCCLSLVYRCNFSIIKGLLQSTTTISWTAFGPQIEPLQNHLAGCEPSTHHFTTGSHKVFMSCSLCTSSFSRRHQPHINGPRSILWTSQNH